MPRMFLWIVLVAGCLTLTACAPSPTPAIPSVSAAPRPTDAPTPTIAPATVQPIAVPAAAKPPRVFSSDPQAVANVKTRITAGDKAVASAFDWLLTEADRALKFEPVSVMTKAITPPSGDKHDYMSMAPYWWPDPTKPNGLPYIRKDGQTNPELHTVPDKDNLNGMSSNAYTLALAYYLKGDEAYAQHAVRLLRTWFLSPETRMNPNMKYGQAVRGVNDGRAEGVLETRTLAKVVDAVGMLADFKGWTLADQQGLVKWFGDYATWMTTDPIGKEEQAATNNHGTWYDAQLVAFLVFSGQADEAKKVLEDSKRKRIDTQIEPDGRQPRETDRADAWHYTVFNLRAFFALATLGDNAGVDLWDYSTSDGRSIRKALDYMVRFIAEEPWPHSNSSDRSWPDIYDTLRQAAIKYGAVNYQQLSSRIITVDPGSARINLLLPAFDPSMVKALPTAVPKPAIAPQPPTGAAASLVICNFQDDISIWQGYDQGTEAIAKTGETPPKGYIPDSKLFAAPLNRWYRPTPGFLSSSEQAKEGKSSGKWDSTVTNNRIVAGDIPHDWSRYQYLSFWVYSVEANKTSVTLAAYSENEPTQENYYRYKITLDWTGWKLFEIRLKDFTITRTPVGWNKVDSIKLASTGWSQTPFSSTVLYFDDMRLTNERTGE